MRREFTVETFVRLRDDSAALFLSDMDFQRCKFLGCVLSNTRDPRFRSTIRNVRLIDCSFDGGLLGPAIVEDVVVHNLKSTDDVFTRGMVFKHVTLSGRMGVLVITPLYPIAGRPDAEAKPINDANANYYRDVDWAIDISGLECRECDIRCIPARLVRRDPATQAVVRRSTLMDGRWKALENCWNYRLEALLREGREDDVLIAAKRAHNFRDQIAGIAALRAAGIADPD